MADDSGFFAVGLLIYQHYRGRRDARLWGMMALALGTAVFQAVHKLERLGVHTGGSFDPKVIAAVCIVSLGIVFLATRIKSVPLPAGIVLAAGGITYPLYLLHMQLGYVIFMRLLQNCMSSCHLRRRVRGIRPRLCRLALLRTIGAPFDPGEADRTCRKSGLFGRREARRSTGLTARADLAAVIDAQIFPSGHCGNARSRPSRSGQITVQSHLQKYFRFSLPPNQNYNPRRLVPCRGVSRSSRTRDGMRWTLMCR